MCKQVICPNDGKPTWWGCGNHIEQALSGIPTSDRCTCEHTRVPSNPNMWEVAPKVGTVTGATSQDV